uniref:KIB1-4 beta-propeller domain-containing protein n=1 Tax=Rhizophora mucronata TaxID=61149 RepID=A0A2P2JFA4_RHIMU
MIKDRLPFVENLTVAVVCKHWHYASQIYPRKDLQSADCRPIWLMRVRYDNKCRGNEQLTNYSTGKKYFVGSLSDTATRVICSQKGWLLLAPQSNYKWPSSGMFLINPFTKQRYDLPIAMHGSIFFPPLTAAISVVNGIPNCVAIGSLDSSFLHNIDFYPLEFILKIAQPDGREWRAYTYDYGTRETNSEDCSSGMFIRNNHVYLIDKVGRTLAFDMIGTT